MVWHSHLEFAFKLLVCLLLFDQRSLAQTTNTNNNNPSTTKYSDIKCSVCPNSGEITVASAEKRNDNNHNYDAILQGDSPSNSTNNTDTQITLGCGNIDQVTGLFTFGECCKEHDNCYSKYKQ